MMRALVSGAGGFIGRHVVRCLVRQGIDVVAQTRAPTGMLQGATEIRADLLATADVQDLVAAARADLLVHLAWYTEHGQYWMSPLNRDWVRATAILVDSFCRAGGHRVVGVGTCAEYEWSQACCREDSTPLVPATPYGAAKDEARRNLVATCDAFGASSAWCRVFIPIGAGESPRRLVPSVIDALRGTREPFVIDGAACRDFLHVTDVAAGVTAVATSSATGAHNVSAGEPTQVADIVRLLANRLGADPRPLAQLFAPRSGEPRVLYGDNARLRSLGWQPSLSVKAAIDRIVAEVEGAPA